MAELADAPHSTLDKSVTGDRKEPIVGNIRREERLPNEGSIATKILSFKSSIVGSNPALALFISLNSFLIN